MTTRRRFTGRAKGAKVALEAIRGELTVSELARKHSVHPNLRQAIEGMPGVFDGKVGDREHERELEVSELHAKIGQLVIERDFWLRPPVPEPRTEEDHGRDRPWGLSIARQCELLSIARSSFYRTACGESEMNLTLMRLIDEQFPRGTVVWLVPDDAPSSPAGLQCGPQADPPLMHKMGLAPIFKKPKTSKPCPEHKVYPYLLKDLVIDRPNRVWCADVTYIQIKRGFLYLVAVMDWTSRKVLSWRLSNTMDTDFCVAALEEAIACYGVPEIFSSRASPSPMC